MGEDDLIRRGDALVVCGAISRNDEAVVVEKLLVSLPAAQADYEARAVLTELEKTE